jgi:hypothetical protein
MPPAGVQNFIDTRLKRPARFAGDLTHYFDWSVPLGESTLIEFSGRDRVHARRKALDWWFHHRGALGLRLRDFLACCRLSDDQRTITFTGTFIRS